MTTGKPLLFKIIDEPKDEPEEVFKRGKSNILLVLIEGESHTFGKLEVEELLHTEGDADIEAEAGMLEDAIAECIGEGIIAKPGRYIVEGFEASYHTDYWGEVDANYSIDGWREATPEDEKQFYHEQPVSA